jgi:long-subunit acyl-CoA synthetase (AMP-forming)
MFAVPRIFEKFLARIDQTPVRLGGEALAFYAVRCCALADRAEAGCKPRSTLGDSVASRAGASRFLHVWGRLRLTVVGGAALDPVIARTFIGLGLCMLQGYGMTEASPVISVNRGDNNDPESVGPPRFRGSTWLNGELAAAAASCWAIGRTRRRLRLGHALVAHRRHRRVREGRIYIRGRRTSLSCQWRKLRRRM